MDKEEVRDRIIEIGIVPVVRASSPGEACLAAEAVCEGGIPIVEITMTVPGAVEVIRDLAKNCPSGVLIGAGTVLNAEAARRCLDAGAQFLVSRSEEHTSELQSHLNLVCRLLLENKTDPTH